MKIKVYMLDVQFPRWLKRMGIFGGIPVAILLGLVHYLRADVAVPNTFADGDTLSAVKMNANFKTLQDAINQATPPGSILAFGGPVVPAGWLPCDGKAVNRADYPALYTAIGTVHGSGDGASTFNLPDLRGRFLRGVDHGTGRDPDATIRLPGANGGQSGDAPGTVQDDAFTRHKHAVQASVGTAVCQLDGGCTGLAGWASGVAKMTYGTATLPYISTEGGSQETRPKNVGVDFIIKY